MGGDEDDQVKQQLHQGMTTHEGGEEGWLGASWKRWSIVVFRKIGTTNINYLTC